MHFNITTASQMEASQRSLEESSGTVSSPPSSSFLSTLFGASAAPENVTTASVSSKLWKLLRTNTSSVHLHILAVKTSGMGAAGKKAKKLSKIGSSSSSSGTSSDGSSDTTVGQDEMAITVDADIEAIGLDEVTSGLLKDGRALYDVVSMVKWDLIPKAYAHRYLLKDVPVVVSGVAEGCMMSPFRSLPRFSLPRYRS